MVAVCLGVTVAGLIDVGFMHKTIMTKGSEAAAQKEMVRDAMRHGA